MVHKPAIRLHWHGPDTVDAASSLLVEGLTIELFFPANYHHAFSSHLNLDSSKKLTEDLSIENGPDLLCRIAEIHGLENVADLIQPAVEAGATIRLKNPAIVIISIPE